MPNEKSGDIKKDTPKLQIFRAPLVRAPNLNDPPREKIEISDIFWLRLPTVIRMDKPYK